MSRLPGVEVVVVGAGVTGAAAAYELSRAGVKTAIIEAGEVGSVASGASAGGVRQQNRDPRELSIAMKAIQRWPHLEDELGADLHYYQDGNVYLVEFEADLPAVEARVKREQEAGLEVEMVDSSCCGMAGNFGLAADTIDVSLAMGELSLLPAVRKAAADTIIVADGTSCRHQIRDGAGRKAVHVARVLAASAQGAARTKAI
jgi:glycine/D-amino acid oxidase-like deaminating enzyme